VEPGEFLVLQDLFLNGRSPIRDIAARTGLAQSRVSTSVRAFTERGWAVTSADPADGRKTLVDLTGEVRAAGARRRGSRAEGSLATALVAGQSPRRFPAPPAASPR